MQFVQFRSTSYDYVQVQASSNLTAQLLAHTNLKFLKLPYACYNYAFI